MTGSAAAAESTQASGGDRVTEVPAGTVAAVYSHVAAVEAILGGMERERAFVTAAWLFYIKFLTDLRLGDRRPELAGWVAYSSGMVHPAGWPPPEPQGETVRGWVAGPRWTAACLAVSAEQQRDVLRGDASGRPPFVRLRPGEAGRLAWLEETVRRFGTGGAPLPVCARGAYDQHLGRPRRRREPVDEAWLAGQVGGALDAAWGVLRPLRVRAVPADPGDRWALTWRRPRLADRG